jgi:dipeptidyl aminopeptidase/acylaminoacyl peptidase
MSANGRYVAFTDSSGATAGKVYIWDTQVAAKVRTNSTVANILRMSINADGTLLAYWAGSQLFAASLVSGTNRAIFTGVAGGNSDNPSLCFSADSRFLAFASKPTSNGTNQSYLYDFQTGSNLLVSHNLSFGPGNRRSDLSGISSDGRFVAYQSRASDIVSGDTNEVADVFLYDRLSGANTLLSLNQAGTAAGNNWSMTPVFSGVGRVLVFASWASDLVSGGFGQKANLFSYAFLYASISKRPEGCVISWPAVSGQNYAVQFTTNVNGGAWQNLNATVTVSGSRGYATNSAADADQKYYRIVSN